MFHSLDDYKNKDEDEQAKKDKRKTTDSYAGGKSSGIAVENPEDDREGFAKTKDKITIKLYRNGFILDDGPFRPLSDPENKKFMDEIERKILPEELVRKIDTKLNIIMKALKITEVQFFKIMLIKHSTSLLNFFVK